MRVDPEAFIDAWMDAYERGLNQTDVARTLGCSSANVSNRARKLRELGVDLPALKVTRGVKLDTNALNERLRQRMNQTPGQREATP